MASVLILSYHFYPSPAVGAKRVGELACRLRDERWEVTVLAAPSDAVAELEERASGVTIHTVRMPAKLYALVSRWPKRILRRLGGRVRKEQRFQPLDGHDGVASEEPNNEKRRETLLAWLKRQYHALEFTVDDRKLWSFGVLIRALRLRRKFDWIISSGPPASIHLAALVLARLTRSPWVMDLRDPWVCNHVWPDQFKSSSALRDKLERWLERTCIANAARVTVASPGIGNALLERVSAVKGKLEVVLNGYDFRAAPPGRPSGRLRLLYAGSLYLNRNPFVLLEALRDLLRLPSVDRSRVSFVLVGRCESWNGRDVNAWIEAAGMQDVVQVLPSVPPATVVKLMEQTEIMVNFAQGQPEQIPAKLYDYIASGREMLLIAELDSDAARITRESGAGRIVEPEDKAALYANLQELYTYYVERELPYTPNEERVRKFSREYQNRLFVDLLAAQHARS